MSGVIVLSGLLFFFFMIVIAQIDYTLMIHHEYMIQRAIQYAIVESYEALSPQVAITNFEHAFKSICPKNYEYEIRLMNFERFPKIVHFEIETVDGTFKMEEILIEEVKDAS